MNLKVMEPKKLYVYPWGEGVFDVRYFTPQILMPSELKSLEKASPGPSGYMPQAYDFKTAVEAVRLTLKDAEPGIYWAGNPQESTYGKWNCVLKAAGWTQVPGCALNRVWGNWQAYKGPGSKNGSYAATTAQPWDSADGFRKWIHAFYYIVPGRKKAIKFDFTNKTRNLQAANGDADLTHGAKGSLWQINYGGSPKIFQKYPSRTPAWCHNFGRLSKSCGIAMGQGLPECGALLDEEFYTIAALDLDQSIPKDWVPFLEYGGLRWMHNLKKLPTAQTPCPHKMEV